MGGGQAEKREGPPGRMDLQHPILVGSQALRSRRRPTRASISASMTLTPLEIEGSVRKKQNKGNGTCEARVTGESDTWEPFTEPKPLERRKRKKGVGTESQRCGKRRGRDIPALSSANTLSKLFLQANTLLIFAFCSTGAEAIADACSESPTPTPGHVGSEEQYDSVASSSSSSSSTSSYSSDDV